MIYQASVWEKPNDDDNDDMDKLVITIDMRKIIWYHTEHCLEILFSYLKNETDASSGVVVVVILQ